VGSAGRQYVEAHHRWSAAADTLERLYQRSIDAKTASAGASFRGR
jgi:hypothetical protein